MKFAKQDVMVAAAVATCAGLLFAISSQAATQTGSGPVQGGVKTVAHHSRAATTKLFTVPIFNPMTAASMPVRPVHLASLMTMPGQRFDWRRGRFSTRELLGLPLDALRRGDAGVPPVYLGRFPENLAKVRDARQRKEIFIKTVLPLVLRVNDEVLSSRRRMLSLIQREQTQNTLSASERGFLDHLAAQYEVADGDRDELRRRVDVIPASLALAQGAEESGWGTSRFARMGNAVFGQRIFRRGGGLVPQQRTAGENFEVKSFDNLYTSVRAYVLNLNTHFAYEKFRKERAALRGGGQPLDGYALIETLISYSERGHKYIDTIRVIMRANDLQDFDDARLLAENGEHRPS